jgi:RNA polymerase-binding transcription factor
VNKEQLEVSRQALIELKTELEQLNADNKEAAGTVTLDQSKVGRLSRMDAMQAQQMAKETERRRQVQLQKIEGALRRLDEGDYGMCFICDEEIDQARLKFDPASTRCVNCMDK